MVSESISEITAFVSIKNVAEVEQKLFSIFGRTDIHNEMEIPFNFGKLVEASTTLEMEHFNCNQAKPSITRLHTLRAKKAVLTFKNLQVALILLPKQLVLDAS